MARRLRVEFPGAIYHVTCRMIGDIPPRAAAGAGGWAPERCLFRDDFDRRRFLKSLGERVEQYDIRLYLFVCMLNHFHLVFETPLGNCGKFMHALSTSYTVYYNLRHRRHGHLLDGRYKAKLVDGDEYLLALSRYVHLNPVCVGTMRRRPLEERVRHLRQYGWSSYPSYIGRRKALDFVDYGPLLAGMGGRRAQWPKRYRESVEAGLAETDVELMDMLKASPLSIGGDGFRAWVDGLYQELLEGRRTDEDVSFRRTTEPIPAERVLEVLADVLGVAVNVFRQRRRNSPLRAMAARCLMRYAGQSQREAAACLDMGSGAAVSRQLKRYEDAMKKDRQLSRPLRQAEKRLDNERRS